MKVKIKKNVLNIVARESDLLMNGIFDNSNEEIKF